jgi:hypothetical protein
LDARLVDEAVFFNTTSGRGCRGSIGEQDVHYASSRKKLSCGDFGALTAMRSDAQATDPGPPRYAELTIHEER